MKFWLAEGNLPNDIFAANDPASIGDLTALFDAGIKGPEEVALVGAGEVHDDNLLPVPLPAVKWDITEMVQQVARLLIETIERKRRKTGGQREIIIASELVVRQSGGSSINN